MSAHKCDVCDVYLTNDEDFKNHNQGQKHKKLFEELKTRCSIYVTGFSLKTEIDLLIKAFEKIGKVVNHFTDAGRRYAIFQFAEESSAKIAINSNLQINGQSLIIKPKLSKDREQLPYFSNKISEKDQECVKQLLSGTRDFNKQLNLFINEIQLPLPVMIDKYTKLCHDLQNVLSTKFSGCIAHPFGSTVTGLGFKKSDLDVYVELINTPPHSPAELTLISKKILLQSRLFNKVIAIPKAKTPIVKCVHIHTGVSCDFNFKSKLGVFNSQLIKYFLINDINFLSAMIIIKYWAKKFGITGTGKITNYCLVLLYLFYLQQKPHSYIPPIYKLQTPEVTRLVEGWNAGFVTDVSLIKRTGSSHNLPDLLLGFFKYYSTFDFGLWVISPLLGELIPKINFLDTNLLPNQLFYYKLRVLESDETPLRIDSYISVQDPFVLNHNVSCYVPPKIMKDFQTLCKGSVNVITTYKSQIDKILYNLFFGIPELKNSPTEIISDNMCVFKIPYNPDINFSKINSGVENKNEALIRIFFDTLTQFMISVLTKVYMFEISVKKETGLKKSIKTDNKTDVHDDDIIDVTIFHCTGKQNYWDGRKGIMKEYESTNVTDNLSVLEKEIKITEHITNVVFKGKNYDHPVLDFDLSIISKKCPVEAKFEINNLKSKCFFKTMCQSLAVSIPNWFDKYVKEMNNLNTNTKISIVTNTNNLDTKESNSVK